MDEDATPAVDSEFLARGLEPLEPFTAPADERRCRCVRCGTTRWVRLRNLRQGGVACRWCHGWSRWTEFAARAEASRGELGTPEESLARLRLLNLAPLTEVGTMYRPVGVVCLECGETFVTVPERIRTGERGYYGCERCASERRKAALADADRVFWASGLELLGPCRGEYVPQPVRCLACGTERRVSYDALRRGKAPLCWTCTHGIRPDEPHRVYLVHFPALGVVKVGLTHDRHDRRLFQHMAEGGELVDTVVVPDRESARRLERYLQAVHEPWPAPSVGPAEFPQGGWTETWSDAAPPLSLSAAAATVLGRDTP